MAAEVHHQSGSLVGMINNFDAELLNRHLPRELSIRNSVVIVIGFIFTYLCFRAIYNVYFHPLSRFPGPFWASASLVSHHQVENFKLCVSKLNSYSYGASIIP
jgi:hypothetical protein